MLHKRAQGGLQHGQGLGEAEWQGTDYGQAKQQRTERRKQRSKTQECVVLPLTRTEGGKHILHNHLIFGKMQVCKYTYIFIYIYISLCKSQSPHGFPFCSWLQEKSLIIQMKRSQEKDHRIWGTVKYHLGTKFKFEHFGNKNVIFIYILKWNFWGSIFFLESRTGSFYNRMHNDF